MVKNLLASMFVVCGLLVGSPAWAYLCVVTITAVPTTTGFTTYDVVTITETLARDTSECPIVDSATGAVLPKLATIYVYKATLTPGTGTTIHPLIGNTAGFTTSSQNFIANATATAVFINEQGGTLYYDADGKLYIRSSPNTVTADNTIVTQMIVKDGAP